MKWGKFINIRCFIQITPICGKIKYRKKEDEQNTQRQIAENLLKLEGTMFEFDKYRLA